MNKIYVLALAALLVQPATTCCKLDSDKLAIGLAGTGLAACGYLGYYLLNYWDQQEKYNRQQNYKAEAQAKVQETHAKFAALLADTQSPDELDQKIKNSYHTYAFPLLASRRFVKLAIADLHKALSPLSEEEAIVHAGLALVQELHYLIKAIENLPQYEEQKLQKHMLDRAQAQQQALIEATRAQQNAFLEAQRAEKYRIAQAAYEARAAQERFLRAQEQTASAAAEQAYIQREQLRVQQEQLRIQKEREREAQRAEQKRIEQAQREAAEQERIAKAKREAAAQEQARIQRERAAAEAQAAEQEKARLKRNADLYEYLTTTV